MASGRDNDIRQTLFIVGGARLTDDENKGISRLNEILNEERRNLPSMRSVDKKKLNIEVERVNKLLGNIIIENITKLNELIYADAVLVAEKLHMFKGKTKKSKSAWEYRLEQQIKNLNQDYSRVKAFYEHAAVKRKHIDRLDRKYQMNEKGKGTVLETIKQRIIAKEGRLKRYRNRVNQYYQNRTFQNNEKRFYQQLNGQVKNSEEAKPNANEAKRFWSNIWDNQKERHRETRWLKELKEELYNIEQQ